MQDFERAGDYLSEFGIAREDPLASAPALALKSLLTRAREGRPGVSVSDAALVRHVAHVTGSPEDLVEVLDKLHAADLLLAFAVTQKDATALRAFDQLLGASARAALARMRFDEDRVSEVVQRVRIACTLGTVKGGPKLLAYSGRGPLSAWLRVAFVNTAYNFKAERGERKDQQEQDTETLADALASDDVEGLTLARLYAKQLRDSVATAIAELTPRERALLRFFLIEGMNVDQIGAVYGLHRATAARHVAKARERLGESVREHFRAGAGTTEAEFHSIVRALPNWLDFSVERLLREKEPGQA